MAWVGHPFGHYFCKYRRGDNIPSAAALEISTAQYSASVRCRENIPSLSKNIGLDDGNLLFVILYFIFINDVFCRSNIIDIIDFRHPDLAVYFVSLLYTCES